MKLNLIAIAVLILSLAAVPPASTDGIIIIDPPIPIPPPDFSKWLTIRYHRVLVTIEGQVATTEVDQVFRNDATVPLEGTYVFPLPAGAAVDDFVMWVDDQALEPQILPADEARVIYEGYVRRNQDPALLEYVGREAIRASIFPIPPQGERRIRLRYTQVLSSEDNVMAYRYLLNTERFSASPLEQVSIVVEVSSSVDLGALYSPTHQDDIVITRQGDRKASVSYEASTIYPDRDFELYIGARTETLGASLLSFRPLDDSGFFLLLLNPALTDTSSVTILRDLIFVLDTSGSMEGEKLDQAKAGLAYVLRHLNDEDRFNVVAFSTQVRAFAPALVGSDEPSRAIAWIEALEAIGGTNIYMALSEALAQVDNARNPTIVFLTDGLPTEGIVDEDVLLGALADEAPRDVRIFPLGVGYDVNVRLLDQLAVDHRGRPTYIDPDERIDEKISTFFARMQSPLLTDISLDFGNVRIFDVYPAVLPDVYAGTQLLVTGRYEGSGPETLTVSGQVNDRQTTYTYDVAFEAHDGEAFIPRLWAARKIGHLLTQIRIRGEESEWIQAIVKLSLQYGIITPYTSFLIEEPTEALSQEGRAEASKMMQDELAAMPAEVSGEQAVEDANLRLRLGGAEAPAAGGAYAPGGNASEAGTTENRAIRYAGNRTFICTSDQCTDTAYVPDTMLLTDVPFLSNAYYDLLATEPALAIAFSLSTNTIVVGTDGVAYRFLLTESADVPREPAPATATPGTAVSPPSGETPQASLETPVPNTEVPATSHEAEPTSGQHACAAPLLALMPLVVLALRRRGRLS